LAYKVLFNAAIEKDLRHIDVTQQKRILDAIQSELSESPRQNGTPLKGKFKGFWKMYVVPYRVIYTVNDREGTVYIEKIGHRKDVYR